MLIKSALLTQASGSIGGMTASRNRGGMYMRARAIPTNPNSERQQQVRSVFGSLIQSWEGDLSDEQRESWNDYAQGFPVTNRVGDAITLSGQQMYVRINAIRRRLAVSTLTASVNTLLVDPPAIIDTGAPVAAIDSFELNNVGDELTVDFQFATPVDAAGIVVFQVGNPINASRRFYKGPYKLAGTTPLFAATDTDQQTDPLEFAEPADWVGGFVPQAGQRVPVRARNVFQDGRISQVFETVVTVTQAT